MINYGKQKIFKEDIDAVVSVLKSDFLTQGPAVKKFEDAISGYCGSKYSLAVSSATAALHLSCLSLNINKNDIVWTSSITFVASANCARYCGATVDFLDIDPLTYNLDINKLQEKLNNAKNNNLLPKAIIVVHMAGHPCDMETIKQLSLEFGFFIIEDASHAIGSSYNSYKTGSCIYSDITVFSFHPVKIITTGEGGIITTNNNSFYNKIKLLLSHGITRDKNLMQNPYEGSWYYEQLELGFNYRMTDIQAILGYSQLKKLDKFVEKRNSIALEYNNKLKNLPIKLPTVLPNCYSSFHLYIIRVNSDKVNKSKISIFEDLRKLEIGVNLHYIPVYLQPYYEKLGFKKGYCQEAENYYKEAISIPIHFGLTNKEINKIVSSLKKVLI